MFKLTDRFWWPVILEVPGDGDMQKHRVELQFKRKTQAEMDALAKDAKTDEEICLEVVVGWRGVKEGGEELAFSEPAFLGMLNEAAGARLTVASTYFDAMQGAARRKNFAGLRGIG
jgi:hypothetical protein